MASVAALGVVLSGAVALAAPGGPLWPAAGPAESAPPEAQSLDEFFAEAPAEEVDPDQAPAEAASQESSEASQATAEVAEEEEEEEEEPDDGEDGGSDDPSGGSGMVDEVVALTNAEREDAGCGPVHVDDRLTEAAQGHSEDMAARDYFDHNTPEGVGPADRAARAGYSAFSGENIAAGHRSAEDVVDAWMNSEGHRRNILNCDSVAIGVGIHEYHWTQVFGYD